MAASEEPTPIRRGRGLRLSTQGPLPEQPPPGEPAGAEGAAPLARGRGLRLSTEGDAPSPPARGQARVPGGLTSYLSAGEGPPLLLLHGFGASGRIWGGVMAALAGRRACYAPDLPGFGASPARRAAPTLDALADEALALADALGLGRFDLAGHSLGAAVAATLAARRPERVGRLALTSLAVRPFAPELLTLAAARPPLDLTLDLARPALELWRPWAGWAMQTPPAAQLLAGLLLARPPADVRRWQEFLADHGGADSRASITSLAAPGDPGLKASLAAIRAPTLLITGREDRVARLPEVTLAHGLVAGSRLRVIEGCGHLPPIERPDEYHALLAEFFAG